MDSFDAYSFDHLSFATGEAAFHEIMDAEWRTALTLPESILPSEWIYQNVVFSKSESSRSGNVRLNGYQRPVADALVDPDVRVVVVKKGTQVGYSMMTALLTIYCLVHEAARVGFIQPTEDDAQEYYNDWIAPREKDVDVFAEIIRPFVRGEIRDKWSVHYYLNGGQLLLRGAASDDAARRWKARRIFLDEVNADSWQHRGKVGSQGSKVANFKERGSDYIDTKIYMGSSSLTSDTVGEEEWLNSNQCKFHVPCPHCGVFQELQWFRDDGSYGFHYRKNEAGIVEACWYECCACEKEIHEEHKADMVDAGHYVPSAVAKVPGQWGYEWPQWLSEAPGTGWVDIAQDWVRAQGKIELLQPWYNNKAAQPFDELAGPTFDQNSAMRQRFRYPAEVPDDVVVLVCGVDTQSNKEGLKGGDADEIASREATVYGWSPGKMPRAISHHVIVGEPGDPAADAELDRIRRRPYLKRDGTEMIVQATAIDMGGHYGDQTKAYCAARRKENCWAVKGRNITLGQRSAAVWPKKVSRNPKAGTTWFMIDTQLAKDSVGRMLKVKGPGGPMFPESFDEDFFTGLAAEALVTDKKGRRFWKRIGSNTGEQWDCLVYAYAALCGLQASFAKWRDLNVAADRAGIPSLPPHDPETGELLDTYEGPDHSIGAATKDSQPAPALAAVPAKDSSNARKAEPVAAPKPESATTVKRKKRKVMRVIRSTRW